jgi:hypothetical protein
MDRYSSNNNNPHFYIHEKNCDGKRPVKRLITSKVELPFCPGMMNNQEFLFLMAHNLMDQWKPTEYFIIYDLETVETIIHNIPIERDGEPSSTQILAKLKPISVSAAYRTKRGIFTSFHCIKDGDNFMLTWMREMIEFAKEIYEDNRYSNPNIPQRNEVVVFGYNNSRFDNNLIFKELHNPPDWSFADVVGDLCNFKQVRIVVPYNRKELLQMDYKEDVEENEFGEKDLENEEEKVDEMDEVRNTKKQILKNVLYIKFYDAMNFVNPMPLREFVKTFRDTPLDDESQMKSFFPYEAFNSSNFMKVLDSDQPFKEKDFYSSRTGSILTNDYNGYLQTYNNLKKELGHNPTRWEYLRYYNE